MLENHLKLKDKFKAPEKSDDQSTQYGKTRVHRNESNLNDEEPILQHTYADCMKGCQDLPYFAAQICSMGCMITNPSGSQPHSQISEKLATTANNLLVESEQLLSMADSLELMGI